MCVRVCVRVLYTELTTMSVDSLAICALTATASALPTVATVTDAASCSLPEGASEAEVAEAEAGTPSPSCT